MKKAFKIFLIIIIICIIIRIVYFIIGYVEFYKTRSHIVKITRNKELLSNLNKYSFDSNKIKAIQKDSWYKLAQNTKREDSVLMYLNRAIRVVEDSLKKE